MFKRIQRESIGIMVTGGRREIVHKTVVPVALKFPEQGHVIPQKLWKNIEVLDVRFTLDGTTEHQNFFLGPRAIHWHGAGIF